jgi:hypothetical protein
MRQGKTAKSAFVGAFRGLIRLMPGELWARSSEMIKHFKLAELED